MVCFNISPLAVLKLILQSKQLELQERKALTFKDQLTSREVQLTSAHRQLEQKVSLCLIINPRCACARVTVVVVCVSVYPSVPTLAASASVETSKQRYSRVSLRLFLDFDRWIFEKTFRSKVMA